MALPHTLSFTHYKVFQSTLPPKASTCTAPANSCEVKDKDFSFPSLAAIKTEILQNERAI